MVEQVVLTGINQTIRQQYGGGVMEEINLQGFDQKLPDRMNLSVIMEKRHSDHPWADFSYRALGAVVADDDEPKAIKQIYQDDLVEHFLISGLSLQLHVDECESYYHNLMSPEPGCFIVAETPADADDMPLPYLVSLSFDEVHSYLEGDEEVYSVAIPKQLYQWVEAYVLSYYVATKKTKRKLKNWHQTEKPMSSENGSKG